MNTKRVERLLRLIQVMQSGRSCTAEDLASQLGHSRRTVFRDLGLLARAGLPFSYDRETRRYAAEHPQLLPPVPFSQGEALALLLAANFALSRQVIPDANAAASALMKLEGMMPPEVRDLCASLVACTDVRPQQESDHAMSGDLVTALQHMAARRFMATAHYDSYFERATIVTTLHPYRVVFMHRGWYLIAWSEFHRSVRTFKIERFLSLKRLDRRFAAPRDFRLDDYFGDAWIMIRGDRRYRVRIRFEPKVAGNVDEIRWHRTQRTAFQPDGSLLFEADVDGVEEIAWWVLGYGDQAEVLEPAELREIIKGHAARMLDRHQGPRRSTTSKRSRMP